MKIFIAGGTGFVGGHLTAELLKRGPNWYFDSCPQRPAAPE